MSRTEEDKVSVGLRMAEERQRLGKSRAEMAELSDKTPQAIGEFERGVSYPGGAVLFAYARAGADVQYILAGVRSENLLQVAEERGRWGLRGRGEKKEIDPVVLAGVIAGVDEYLAEQHKTMRPAKKAELILLLCDFLSAEAARDKASVKTAVAKVIQLRGGRG